jgi:hypothetical protein
MCSASFKVQSIGLASEEIDKTFCRTPFGTDVDIFIDANSSRNRSNYQSGKCR